MEHSLMLIYLLLSPSLQDSIGIFLTLKARSFSRQIQELVGISGEGEDLSVLTGISKHLQYPVRVQGGT